MPGTDTAAQGGGGMLSLVMLVVLIGVMYFLMIRPQRKKEKEITVMRNQIRVGDDVITIGGICGKIVKTKEDVLTIQVGADKTKFDIMRWGISRVVTESTNKQVKADKPEKDAEEETQPRALPKRLKSKSADNSSKGVDIDSEAPEEDD
jgi:preprotein translocase subunit YajC